MEKNNNKKGKIDKEAKDYIDYKASELRHFEWYYWFLLFLGVLGVIIIFLIFVSIDNHNKSINRDIEMFLMRKNISLLEYEKWKAKTWKLKTRTLL